MSDLNPVVSSRLPEDLRRKLRDFCTANKTTENNLILTILDNLLNQKEGTFITYENLYLKIILDRTLFNTHQIIEHLKKAGNPEWDAKGYHAAASKKAYDAQDFAHKEAMRILQSIGAKKGEEKEERTNENKEKKKEQEKEHDR